MGLRFRRAILTFLAAGSLFAPVPVCSQVLARPGWAGSGVAPEAWWSRAVFYRLDPERFQDSDGDGTGDIAGLISRLDYMQSLGVDALVLDSKAPIPAETLGDLVHAASDHRLRVLVTLRGLGGGDALQMVHEALGAGAAGVWMPHEAPMSGADYAALLDRVRGAMTGFPGERVLLTDPAPVPLSLAPEARTRRIDPGAFHAARANVLVLRAAFAVEMSAGGAVEMSPLLASLHAASEGEEAGGQPLLAFARPPATASPADAAGALALLGSRGAVLLDFGEELGLDLYTPVAGTDVLPVMQWTPGNRTLAPAAPASEAPAKSAEPQFGAYHPYVPPPRGLGVPSSAAVKVVPDRNIPDALPAPDTLPGFTAGTLPDAPLTAAHGTLDVITEDRDPQSLLNLYRQLIALHHDSPALRNGAEAVLPGTTAGTVAWVRRVPAGTRTSGAVLAAMNLTGEPLTLALGDGRAAALRTLVSFPREPLLTGQTTAHLLLPPHAVFLGEPGRGGLPAAGGSEGASPAVGHRGRRRHRVRR